MEFRSDIGIYVGAGLFAICVFVLALFALRAWTGVELTTGTLLTLAVGFSLFMGTYFSALAIYRGIERRERGLEE